MLSYRSRVGRAPALVWRAWGCGRHTPCPHSPARLITEGAAPNPMVGGGLAGGRCQHVLYGQLMPGPPRACAQPGERPLSPAFPSKLPTLNF